MIVCAFILGMYMHGLPVSPQKLKLYAYHKWLGVTIFALAAVRFLVRWRFPPPPFLSAPAWQLQLARSAHHLLYLLMFAVPICGWLMSSAKGFQTVWFGVLPLPDLLDKDEALGRSLRKLHEQLSWGLILLAILHAGAALKHHFFDRDATLVRMLPWTKP